MSGHRIICSPPHSKNCWFRNPHPWKTDIVYGLLKKEDECETNFKDKHTGPKKFIL